jgi:hypothetical protein
MGIRGRIVLAQIRIGFTTSELLHLAHGSSAPVKGALE